jgi:hypothetical protein
LHNAALAVLFFHRYYPEISMKRILAFALLSGLTFELSASVAVEKKILQKAYGYDIISAKVSSGQGSLTKRVYIVNGTEKTPKKFIWLFHGYKPAGDPYRQSPEIFIQKWNLVQVCRKNNYVCIVPDMGTSMYVLSDLNNSEKVSDMRFLKELYNEAIFKLYKDAPLIVIGVSTGVEGAVKFSSIVQNVESIVGLSGTYDFFSLNRESGEYRIHERVFGTDQSLWRNENPLDILKRSARTRLYVLCESQSIYYPQAKMLLDDKMSNVEAVNVLDLGKGYSHSWGFWGSSKVIRKVQEILVSK